MKLALHFGVLVMAGLFPVYGVDFARSTGDLLYDDGEGHTLPYRVFVPEEYDPGDAGTRYPLVLFFHGAGERGQDNRSQVGGGHVENLYRASQGTTFDGRYQAFLLAPQCPTSDQWVNWPWNRGSYTQAEEPAESRPMTSALAILDEVISSFPVNTDQVYVTGLSMGGFGTWDALRRRPELFAAAMPLSGGGNKDQGLLFRSIPIWAYHGSRDSIVPVLGADEMRDSIAAAGGFMEYTRVRGGHDGWGTFYNNRTRRNSVDQTVYEWLFAQRLQNRLEPFAITAIDAEEEVTLTWNSRPGRHYVIESLSSAETGWSDLPASIGSGGATTSYAFPRAAELASAVFRVRDGYPSVNLLEETAVRWLVPTGAALEATWYSAEAPLPGEAGFVTGSGQGVGFETGTEAFAPSISTDVEEAMLRANATIYLRYPFVIPEPRQYRTLSLRIRYNDGFVAYLNGSEIARRHAPEGAPAWNSTATASQVEAGASAVEEIDLTGSIGLLRPGEENLLAIHGLNGEAAGADFLILPRLEGEFGEGG